MKFPNTSEWLERLKNGDRGLLSRTITLAESSRIEDKLLLQDLFDSSPSSSQKANKLAISGIPGVGKSTFIQSFGQLIAKNEKLAVLTIDPSSPQSGGSILGDKTRMDKLSVNPNVFIRPSPSGRQAGGVAAATSDLIKICEFAGFKWIIIETVGVGQSEVHARYLSDYFILLLLAGGGDELQGIKRGIMEMADYFVFNKTDITPGRVMHKAKRDLSSALHLLRSDMPNEEVVFDVSSTDSSSLEKFYEHIKKRISADLQANTSQQKGSKFEKLQFDHLLNSAIIEAVKSKPENKEQVELLRKEVEKGNITALNAVKSFLSFFLKKR